MAPGANCTISCRDGFDGNGTATFGCWYGKKFFAVVAFNNILIRSKSTKLIAKTRQDKTRQDKTGSGPA